MNILIAGGTGFLGTALVEQLLRRGDRVVALVRDPVSARRRLPSDVLIAKWDGMTAGDWTRHVGEADAVINLSGEPIAAKRWTEKRKQKILQSRILPTRALVLAMAAGKKKPSVLINASAIGFYGFSEAPPATEETPSAGGFLAETCSMWEQEALAARSAGVRVVLPRLGIVLGDDGGALQKMLLPFRLFMGGPIGSGLQWFPWVHRDDVIGALLFAVDTPDLHGPVNCVAPENVRMDDLCRTLARVLARPSWLRVPGFILRFLLGEMAGMVLGGRRVLPVLLTETGYTFAYPRLEGALRAILD
jgi:uncharacterized protein (TIGR01777 family)